MTKEKEFMDRLDARQLQNFYTKLLCFDSHKYIKSPNVKLAKEFDLGCFQSLRKLGREILRDLLDLQNKYRDNVEAIRLLKTLQKNLSDAISLITISSNDPDKLDLKNYDKAIKAALDVWSDFLAEIKI